MGDKASTRRADPTRFGLCYGEIRSRSWTLVPREEKNESLTRH